MRTRAALFSVVLAGLAGCAAMSEPGIDASEVGPPPFPECRADSYAFAGRGTFAALGLVGQSKAVLPEPNRPASIWVTRDPVAFDAADPGGSRMLCFEFDDGSGGSEWPIDAAWQLPGAGVSSDGSVGMAPLLAVVATMLVLAVGVFAFRRH